MSVMVRLQILWTEMQIFNYFATRIAQGICTFAPYSFAH
jgi:hypothetical protein